MHISEEDYRTIEEQITSESSPVGIDAKKTHVMILAKLESLEQRLARIEEQLQSRNAPLPGK